MTNDQVSAAPIDFSSSLTIQDLDLSRAGRVVVGPYVDILVDLAVADSTSSVIARIRTSGCMDAGPDAIRGAVQLRDRLPSALRARLDTVALWPLQPILDGDLLRGVLLPRPSPDFRHRIRLPSDRWRVVDRHVRQLFVDPARAHWLRLAEPSADERLGICAAVAEALAFLHELGASPGGLTSERVLFRVSPQPQVLLVGGERAAPLSPNTVTTDLRDLALLVLRVLTPGPFCSVSVDPQRAAGKLDPDGMALLARALGEPDSAPSAATWARYLASQPGQPRRPPVVDAVSLDRTLVAPGGPVTVSWVARFAGTVEVSGPRCEPVRMATDGASWGEVTVRPMSSGPLSLVARNDAGAADLSLGHVAVLGPLQGEQLPVTMPDLSWPSLHPADLPDLAAVLPALPSSESARPLDATALLTAAPTGPCPPNVLAGLPAPPGFDAGPAAFPIDVVAIHGCAPDLERPRRNRKSRWRK